MIDKDPRQIEMPFPLKLIQGNKTIYDYFHVEWCHKFLSENLPKQEADKKDVGNN